MSAVSIADASGTYVANVITKQGRGEVQIYPVATLTAQLSDSLLVRRHELEFDQNIESFAWFNETEQQSRGSKRKTNGASENKALASSLLAVALLSGEVLVFSPYKETPQTVYSGEKLVSLASTNVPNRFWGLQENGVLLEIDASSRLCVNTLKTRVLASVLAATARKSNEVSDGLLLAGKNVYFVDGAKSDAAVETCGSYPKKVVCVALAASKSREMAVVTEGLSSVEFYNPALRRERKNLAILSPISRIYMLVPELLAVVAADGVHIVQMESRKVVTRIPAALGIDYVFRANSGIVGVSHDKFQMSCTQLASSVEEFSTFEASQLVMDGADLEDAKAAPVLDVTISVSGPETIENVPSELLYAQIVELLNDEDASAMTKKLLQLCESNDDADNIKNAVRRFSSADSALVERFFIIVAKKLAQDPTQTLSLPVWLKWLLLAHGGMLLGRADLGNQLRSLRLLLEEGLAMMPKLMALQGRFELLRTQAELRAKVNASEDDEDEETTETFIDTTNVEESVVYENGEGA